MPFEIDVISAVLKKSVSEQTAALIVNYRAAVFIFFGSISLRGSFRRRILYEAYTRFGTRPVLKNKVESFAEYVIIFTEYPNWRYTALIFRNPAIR